MNTHKLLTWSMFALLAVALMPLMVSADLELNQQTFSKNNPTFGGPNQEASNSEHEDDDDQVVKVQRDISLKNNGTLDLKDFSLIFLPTGGFDISGSDIVGLNLNGFTITKDGGIGAIKFEAKIPEDLDAVDTDFEEAGFKVGELTINAKDEDDIPITPLIFDVFMQRENKLEIKDADAEVDNDKQSIDDGDEIKDLRPGDQVDVEVEVENNYDDNSRQDIEDVEIEIDCDPDDDLDFEDESQELGDLGTEDDETETLSFDIEEDAEDDTIDCLLTVDGTDENGARHGERIQFDLDIIRKSHDLVIKNVLVNPTLLQCEDNSIQLTIDVLNLGRSDEDNVAVEITSKTLGVLERISNIELDEDDSLSESFSISLDAENLAAGSYAFQVQTFYDNVKLSDTEIVAMENTCNDFSFEDNGDDADDSNDNVEEFVSAISLKESTVTATVDSASSVEILVTNIGSKAVDYTVSLENVDEFAAGTASKTVRLNPGQASTIFFNMKVKDNVEEGVYSAIVKLRDAKSGATVETQTFAVEVLENDATESNGLDLNFGGGDSSRVLLILGNVVLVILAILFIKLIFTPSKRGARPTQRPEKVKVADYEPVNRQKRKRRTVKRKRKK